jgi:hypothetical protein
MVKVKQFLLKLKEKAVMALKEAWWTEPALVTSGVVSAVVALAAAVGVIVPAHTIELVVSFLLPIAIGGIIRSQVQPVAGREALSKARGR